MHSGWQRGCRFSKWRRDRNTGTAVWLQVQQVGQTCVCRSADAHGMLCPPGRVSACPILDADMQQVPC